MWGFVIWQIFNFLLILRNPRTVCSKRIVAKTLNIVKRKLTHHMRIEICSHINLFFASLVSCFCYKILHIYIRAIIFDTTAKRIKELESRQKEIEIKITKEKSKKTFKLSRRNITTYFAEALTLSPDLLINYLVKKIVLYDDKIYFESPTNAFISVWYIGESTAYDDEK